ncbi:MAG: hypothetical protein JXA23_07125, partial [Bacteroidales bacterium]|nr:hypothetical protein [Bacteroidales bacterium]
YTLPASIGGLILQPAWSADERYLAFLYLDHYGKSMKMIDLLTQTLITPLQPGFEELNGPPLFYREYLLFSAGYTGIENIFAMNWKTGKLFQVTSSRFGARQPALSPDQSTLVYADYSADGWMIVTRPVDQDKWIPVNNTPTFPFSLSGALSKHKSSPSLISSLAEAMAEQEGVNVQDSMRVKYEVRSGRYDSPVTSRQSPVTRYRKFSHLFNVHSWAPVSIDANNLTLKPGVSVLSQNLLSTAYAGAGYEYDLNERTGKFYLNFSYQGWFPVIDLNYSYGKRAGTGRYSNTGESFRYTWNESDLQATVSVPLNLTRGNWYRKIQPSVGTSWIYVIHDKTTPQAFTKGSVNTLDYRLYLYNYIRSNYQDMFPKWGQQLDIGYRHTPFSGNDMGEIFGISGNLYFPGAFRHHGIRIYAGYQRRWDHLVYGYQFSNLISFPRGTETFYPEKLVSVSANYKFPFLRLDASIGSVLYIKRFKLNLFYDWAHGWQQMEETFTESAGFELTSELHILRFLAPFELGVQGAYLPDEGRWAWRFLWGISF